MMPPLALRHAADGCFSALFRFTMPIRATRAIRALCHAPARYCRHDAVIDTSLRCYVAAITPPMLPASDDNKCRQARRGCGNEGDINIIALTLQFDNISQRGAFLMLFCYALTLRGARCAHNIITLRR